MAFIQYITADIIVIASLFEAIFQKNIIVIE